MKQFLTLLLLIPSLSWSQFTHRPSVGVQGGLVYQFGTHQHKIGGTLNLFYHDFFYQINIGNSLVYQLKSYGNTKRFWENRVHIGAILLAGKKQQQLSPLISGLQHQTPYNLGLAYNYIWYLNHVGTKQNSGAFGLHIRSFFIGMENDIFGGQGKDRFRTASLYAHYRLEQLTLFTQVFLWTGETSGSKWIKTAGTKMPNGYRELTNLPFGNITHGIANFGMHYHLPYHQLATVKIGIDSEQIRHQIQNRFGHDLVFAPKFIPRKTPHYPRLNSNGEPIFEKKEKRKDRLFFSLSLNDYLLD